MPTSELRQIIPLVLHRKFHEEATIFFFFRMGFWLIITKRSASEEFLSVREVGMPRNFLCLGLYENKVFRNSLIPPSHGKPVPLYPQNLVLTMWLIMARRASQRLESNHSWSLPSFAALENPGGVGDWARQASSGPDSRVSIFSQTSFSSCSVKTL